MTKAKNARVHVSGAAEAFKEDEVECARKTNKVLQLDIKLSMKCTGRCIYCYADAGECLKDELSCEEVFDIVDQAAALGVKAVNLTGGEVMECGHFLDIAEYAKSKKMMVMSFTNGMGVTKEIAKKMYDLELAPCVKRDALDDEIQDYLFGMKGAGRRIMAGIQNLIDVGYAVDFPALSINSVITSVNYDEIPRVWRWAMENDITPHATTLQLMGRGQGLKQLQITPKRFYELLVKISEIDKEFGVEWEPILPWARNRACKRHKIGCLVTSTGNIQPCSGIPIVFGNLREQTFKEVVESEAFLKWRQIDKMLEGACGRCEDNHRCYGCRSQAYWTTGSVYSEEPMCWREK